MARRPPSRAHSQSAKQIDGGRRGRGRVQAVVGRAARARRLELQVVDLERALGVLAVRVLVAGERRARKAASARRRGRRRQRQRWLRLRLRVLLLLLQHDDQPAGRPRLLG